MLMQYLLIKKQMFKKLMNLNLVKLMVLTSLGLLLSVVLGSVFKVTAVPIMTTIFFASIISTKMRERFSIIEKGGKL